MDWLHRALCRDLAADGLIFHDLFFPVSEHGPGAAQAAEAKQVCHDCPVLGDCRAWALQTAQPYGVAGGLTATERDVLLRRDAAVNLRTAPGRSDTCNGGKSRLPLGVPYGTVNT